MGLKDAVNFYTPEGILFVQYPFDGNEKTNFKHYWTPSLIKRLDICDVEQLIGEWTVLFAGLPNEKLHFQVTNEILPGFEEYYVTCNEKALEMPIMTDPTYLLHHRNELVSYLNSIFFDHLFYTIN